MFKFNYSTIAYQPHPLYPPLLGRRGGIFYIREASPPFDSPKRERGKKKKEGLTPLLNALLA